MAGDDRGAPRRFGVGLDFGTSNSAAAWFDGERLQRVVLEHNGPILPTAIHLDRAYTALVGSAAIERYVEENRGRRVELVAEVLGESAASVGGNSTGEDISRLQTERHTVYGPLYDRTLPGRLFLGLKRLLGDPEIERLTVFDRQYRLVALLTPILQHIRAELERELSHPLPALHAGRPVTFEGRTGSRDATAVARLREAYEHAGLAVAEFYPEPVAATLSWLHSARRLDRGVALTVDFGGGTLDLAAVRFDGQKFQVLATQGMALGGDRIDQLIFAQMLFPELGKGERWVRDVDGREIDTLFPFDEFEPSLINWPTTFLLNQNQTRAMVVDRLARGGPGAAKFQRLLDLISFNYSYNCFQAIRRAKVELSSQLQTSIDIPELNLNVAFSRSRLDDILVPVLARARECIDALLQRARLAPADVDVVIRTGGSSEIVAVRALLERQFPGRVEGHDPFTSVACGQAIANWQGLHHRL
ncbi:MAG TPA: Hsp70 family protein [Steroidobacteraceae bacterium]|nr:Hsp70 family protein [Steroidobacteraceae bacterium]